MFANPKEVIQFVDQRKNETGSLRAEMAVAIGVLQCYKEGIQWISDARAWRAAQVGGQNPYPVNFDPDAGKMRVNDNVFTRYVIEASAATYPRAIECRFSPPERDAGVEDEYLSDLLENAAQVGIKSSGYLDAARCANDNRGLCGTWGIGLRIETSDAPVEVDGQTIPAQNRRLVAFDFDPSRLILDPAEKNRDLTRHEYVCYRDPMTKFGLKAVLGIEVPDDQLRPIGTVTQVEQNIADFTGGRMFAKYKRASKTPGAMVTSVYERTPGGRFERCYYVVDLVDGPTVVNADNPANPFAGCGLPLSFLYGHRRGDTLWGIGDGSMTKGDQDKRNALLTLTFRHIHKHSGFQWVVDKRWLQQGSRMNDEDVRKVFTNLVSGVITGGGSSDRTVQPPQLVQTPAPQPFIMDMLGVSEHQMRSNVFRSEGTEGLTKSHVPDASFQRAIEEADRVLGIRITEDISAHERLLDVMLATQVRGVSGVSPVTLADLRAQGFTDEDLGTLASLDPQRLPGCLRISDSSIRYRPLESRKNDLDKAVAGQVISPSEARLAMAGELDTPLADRDKTMLNNIRRMVLYVVRGEEWDPVPLGQYTGWALDELRTAMFDRKARGDRTIRDRLVRAMMSQQQFAAAELAMSQPPEPAQGQESPAPLDQDPIAGLIGQFTGGGARVSAQPA